MRSHFLSMLFRVFVVSSLVGVAAMSASRQAYSEQITPASKERLYLEETVIQSPADPAFKSYWRDQTDLIWWDSRKPVVRTGHVTDADGGRLVVTTIFAIPLCDISGCPVRIQTEQSEKLLDRVQACEWRKITICRQTGALSSPAMRDFQYRDMPLPRRS